VLLQAWDCFTTSDGVSKMRSSPTTLCTSASHLAFQRMATAIICLVGPGVPIMYALWIFRLRRVAMERTELSESAWCGLADPATRSAWGSLYEMYRYSSVPDALERGVSPGTRWERFKDWRFKVSVHVSPFFESFLFVEKLMLVLAMHTISTPGGQAGAQAAIYVIFALLVAFIWPFRKLDVRIGLFFWWSTLPARWQPESDLPSFHVGWRRVCCGYVWRNHITLLDCLNLTALSANVVPFVNIIATLMVGEGGQGEAVLAVFLIGAHFRAWARHAGSVFMCLHHLSGVNCLEIALTVAAWVSCVVTWQTQTLSLVKLERQRKERLRNAPAGVCDRLACRADGLLTRLGRVQRRRGGRREPAVPVG
jgi:hypothetical protein